MKIANSKHNKNSYDFFMKYMNDLTVENELCGNVEHYICGC